MIVTHSKDWDALQIVQVYAALRRYHDEIHRLKHPYSQLLSYELGCARVMSGEVPAVIIGNYLLMYQVGSLWFSPDAVLVEQSMVKLNPNGESDFDGFLQAVNDLSKTLGCKMYVLGNGSGRPALTRFYKSRGLEISNTEFIMEVS